jgi:hypothetical protein
LFGALLVTNLEKLEGDAAQQGSQIRRELKEEQIKQMKINHFLAIGAMLVGSSAFAAPIYGTATQTVTINGVPTATGIAQNTKTGSGGGAGTGYSFGMTWDVDPVLTWSFTTSLSGLHVLEFTTNIVPDSYDSVFVSNGLVLTGGQGGSGAKITDVSLQLFIPAFSTYVSAGDVNLKGTGASFIKGTYSKSDDNSGLGGVGPYVPFGPTTLADGSMGVRITFTTDLGDNSTLSLNGTLDIQKSAAPPVPEPATFGLIGAALIALGSIARRRA